MRLWGGGGGNSLSLSSHQTALYSVVGQENYNNEELHLPAMDCIIILGSVAPLILDELLGFYQCFIRYTSFNNF